MSKKILMQNNTGFLSCAQWVAFGAAQIFWLQTVFLFSVPRLLIMKDMVRRLQELRHTEQVQRAYALNCGEGATVSYEIQIRVLREFGLADAAAELLQVGMAFDCEIEGLDPRVDGISDIPGALPACICFLVHALSLPQRSGRPWKSPLGRGGVWSGWSTGALVGELSL